jgi:uncharacterized membrane protein
MNAFHTHLLLNHFPVALSLVGYIIAFSGTFMGRRDVIKTGMLVLVAMGISSIVTWLSGYVAASDAQTEQWLPGSMVSEHASYATLSLWTSVIVASLAFVQWLGSVRSQAERNFFLKLVFVLGVLHIFLLGYTSFLGAKIRHQEIWNTTRTILSR